MLVSFDLATQEVVSDAFVHDEREFGVALGTGVVGVILDAVFETFLAVAIDSSES